MAKQKGRKLAMDELGRKSISEFKRDEKLPITIVLDDIRSLSNVGSIFRTADAFGIERIVLCGITAKPPHREIQKTALGATESVDWDYVKSCTDALSELKNSGYLILGVEQVEGSCKLADFNYSTDEKLAVVLGNEVNGVSQRVLNLCDDYLEIPQSGTKHSLNVSVAAGVVLWELCKKFSA